MGNYRAINLRMIKIIFLFCFLAINVGFTCARKSIPFPTIERQTISGLSKETLERVNKNREKFANKTGVPNLTNGYPKCIIEMEMVNDGSGDVRAYLNCDDVNLYDKTLPIEQHQEFKSEDDVIVLFPKDHGVYVLIQEASDIDIISSRFVDLPSIPGKDMEAIVKVVNGRGTFTDFTCEKNTYGTVSGCLYFTGLAFYDVENCIISSSRGFYAGAVTAIDDSRIDMEECDFTGNTGDKYAGSIYVQDHVFFEILSCEFSGVPLTEEFKKSFLNSLDTPSNDDNVDLTPRSGAIAANGVAVVDIYDCTFTQLSGQLGTIFAYERTASFITSCNFIQNYVSYGGGVYLQSERDGYLRIYNSKFEQNVARYGGAAVVSGQGSFSLDKSTFIGNTALWGGAVYGVFSYDNTTSSDTCPEGGAYKGSRMTIYDTEFRQNVAQRSGGAFYTKCTDIVMENSEVSDNVSGEDGGAIFIQYGWDLNFENIKFENNVAVNKGGAVFVDDAHIVKTKNSTFNGNVISNGEGGGLFIKDASGLHVDETNFYGGTARIGGAAISAVGVETFVANNFSVGECQGGQIGGAILSSESKIVNMTNLYLYNNTADSAGAISVSTTDELNLENINFVTNVAIFKDGGSLNIEKSTNVNLKNIKFDQSRAYYSCGALRAYDTKSMTIFETDFISNTAQSMHGGAICLEKVENAIIEQSKFGSSRSERTGGHIYFSESGILSMSNSLMEEGAAESGGSIGGEGLEHLIMSNMTMLNNAATMYGGAVYTDLAFKVEIRDSEFTSNYASWTHHISNDMVTNTYFYKCQGGAISASNGETFVSSNTLYQDCQADDRGGDLMLDGFVDVTLTHDVYLNGKSGHVGGCFYVNSVNNMHIDNVEVMFCESEEGGAMFLEGNSGLKIFESSFVNNSASSGGAILCRENTVIDIVNGLFNYNAAKDGATLTTDCYCNVSISDSTISRDDESDIVGDFFYENSDSCTVINTNNVNFIGAIIIKTSLALIVTLVVIFSIVGCLGTSGSMYYVLSRHRPGPMYTFSSDEENPEIGNEDELQKPLIVPVSIDNTPHPPIPSGKASSSKPVFKRVPTDVGLPDSSSSEGSSEYTTDDSDTETDSVESKSEYERDVKVKTRDISSETQPLVVKDADSSTLVEDIGPSSAKHEEISEIKEPENVMVAKDEESHVKESDDLVDDDVGAYSGANKGTEINEIVEPENLVQVKESDDLVDDDVGAYSSAKYEEFKSDEKRESD